MKFQSLIKIAALGSRWAILFLCCEGFIFIDAAMLFWELEPNFIAVYIFLSIYFDFHLMLLNGGRDQFEVAKVLHLPDGCFERVCGFVGNHLNKFGADAELERIALSGFKPVAEAKFNSADRDLFVQQRRAGEKVHGRGADKIAHKGGGGPLEKLLGVPICTMRPWFITMILWAKVMASF